MDEQPKKDFKFSPLFKVQFDPLPQLNVPKSFVFAEQEREKPVPESVDKINELARLHVYAEHVVAAYGWPLRVALEWAKDKEIRRFWFSDENKRCQQSLAAGESTAMATAHLKPGQHVVAFRFLMEWDFYNKTMFSKW